MHKPIQPTQDPLFQDTEEDDFSLSYTVGGAIRHSYDCYEEDISDKRDQFQTQLGPASSGQVPLYCIMKIKKNSRVSGSLSIGIQEHGAGKSHDTSKDHQVCFEAIERGIRERFPPKRASLRSKTLAEKRKAAAKLQR